MVKVKIVDLFGVKFDTMESKINQEILNLEKAGHKISKVEILGDSLKSASVFLIYE